MTTTRRKNLAAALVLLAATSARAQIVETRIGKLEFELGVPTEKTAAKLYDEMDFQRAVQCYLWALTIVGVEQSIQGLIHDTGAKSGDVRWNRTTTGRGRCRTSRR